MHYCYFHSKHLLTVINPAQPSNHFIWHMLFTWSIQLKMSSARPKTVFPFAIVPSYSRWPSVILISHLNSQLWSRHKSDELYFSVSADAIRGLFMDLQTWNYHSRCPPGKACDVCQRSKFNIAATKSKWREKNMKHQQAQSVPWATCALNSSARAFR